MARWQDTYKKRDEVEALFPLATGDKWVRAFVSRKTATGFPIVTARFSGFPQLAIDRKRDIRFPIPMVSP